jgi:hypothetical protein
MTGRVDKNGADRNAAQSLCTPFVVATSLLAIAAGASCSVLELRLVTV